MVTPRSGRRSRPLSRRPFSRSPSRRSPRLLHHLAALLSLAGQRAGQTRQTIGTAEVEGRPSTVRRRRLQHLALAQRLLDPLPPALSPPYPEAERFWRALRWGGLGVLIACWLGG